MKATPTIPELVHLAHLCNERSTASGKNTRKGFPGQTRKSSKRWSWLKPIIYMYHIFSIHSSVDGHSGCFCVPTIVNSAAINIGVHVSFWIMVFPGYMPSSRIAGLRVSITNLVQQQHFLLDCCNSSLIGLPFPFMPLWTHLSHNEESDLLNVNLIVTSLMNTSWSPTAFHTKCKLLIIT